MLLIMNDTYLDLANIQYFLLRVQYHQITYVYW